jgi:cell division protein FtsL
MKLTVAQASNMKSLSTGRIYAKIKSGELKHTIDGGPDNYLGVKLIEEEDLDAVFGVAVTEENIEKRRIARNEKDIAVFKADISSLRKQLGKKIAREKNEDKKQKQQISDLSRKVFILNVNLSIAEQTKIDAVKVSEQFSPIFSYIATKNKWNALPLKNKYSFSEVEKLIKGAVGVIVFSMGILIGGRTFSTLNDLTKFKNFSFHSP